MDPLKATDTATGILPGPTESFQIFPSRRLPQAILQDDTFDTSPDSTVMAFVHDQITCSSQASIAEESFESPQSSLESFSSHTSSTTREHRGRKKHYLPLGAFVSAAGSNSRSNVLASNAEQSRDVTATIVVPPPPPPASGSEPSFDDGLASASDSSASDDIDSRISDIQLMESMKQHWERLSMQRFEVRCLLDDLLRRRTDLKDLGKEKDDADRGLIVAIRKERFDLDPARLEPYMIAVETAKLKYQAAEAIVDQLLEKIDEAELDVEILEKRFYNKIVRNGLSPSLPDKNSAESVDDESEEYDPPSRTSLLGISWDKAEDVHPAYERLRETYGELQLAREYRHNLISKRLVVLEQDYDELTSEALEFLNTFEKSIDEATAEIESWSNRFEELRVQCRQQGLIPQSSPFYADDSRPEHRDTPMTGRQDIFLDLGPLDRDPSSYSVYPLLVTQSRHLLSNPFPITSKVALKRALSLPPTAPSRSRAIAEAMNEYSISTLLQEAEPEDKNDFINRWLLQKLRLSPMEAEVLRSTFRKILRVLDLERWQLDVLRFWSRDKAAERHVVRSTSDPSSKQQESRSRPPSRTVSEPIQSRIAPQDNIGP